MITFNHHESGTIAIMELSGRLDASVADQLPEAFKQVFAGHQDIIMDLTNLEFIDSTGLGMVIFCLRLVQEQEGRFSMVVVPGRASTVLDITKAKRLFDIFPTVDLAVAALQE